MNDQMTVIHKRISLGIQQWKDAQVQLHHRVWPVPYQCAVGSLRQIQSRALADQQSRSRFGVPQLHNSDIHVKTSCDYKLPRFSLNQPSCPARLPKEYVLKHFEALALFAKGSRKPQFINYSNCDLPITKRQFDRQVTIAQPQKGWAGIQAYGHRPKKSHLPLVIDLFSGQVASQRSTRLLNTDLKRHVNRMGIEWLQSWIFGRKIRHLTETLRPNQYGAPPRIGLNLDRDFRERAQADSHMTGSASKTQLL